MDSFQLFDRAVSNFTAVNLPALSSPLSWTNKLAINGSIAVFSGVNTTPGIITNTFAGNNLTMSWSADRIGWRLVTHTNLAAPVASWVTVPGSAGVNTITVPVNTNGPQAYFRMVNP